MRTKTMILVCVILLWFLLVPGLVLARGQYEENSMSGLSCVDCHSSTSPKYPLLGAAEGYEYSGHDRGFENEEQNSYYANGGGCQRCHTNEGFIAYLETGSNDSENYIEYPSQPGCFSCHAPHETGDFSVRTNSPVKLADGTMTSLGEGNLCANCHMARREAASYVQASPADKVSSHWGGHHGPQADLLVGTNAYENPNKSYSSSPHSVVLKNGCVDCHMYLPEGRFSMSPEVGGHSFNIGGEVHGVEKLNVKACADCHDGIKQVSGKEIFALKAKADYDNDGGVEYFQEEVHGLLEQLVNHNGSGLLQRLNPPMYKADGSWNTARSGERSLAQMAALWNFKIFEEDRSLGVHNGVYTIQVLMDSIEALDSSFDMSARPR